MGTLLPFKPELGQLYESNEAIRSATAQFNAALQAGYFILAVRARGLAAGPMSGFDAAGTRRRLLPGGAVAVAAGRSTSDTRARTRGSTGFPVSTLPSACVGNNRPDSHGARQHQPHTCLPASRSTGRSKISSPTALSSKGLSMRNSSGRSVLHRPVAPCRLVRISRVDITAAGCASPASTAVHTSPAASAIGRKTQRLDDPARRSRLHRPGTLRRRRCDTEYRRTVAQEGLQFSNFHAYPGLCTHPSRIDDRAGSAPGRFGFDGRLSLPRGYRPPLPGYRGTLDGDYTGIADVLSDADYSTYQVGKWHLGDEPGQTPGDLGFEQNFTCTTVLRPIMPTSCGTLRVMWNR